MCRQDSIEVDELQYPIHVSKRYVTMDTEGAGKFRGSPSAYCEFGPIDDCSMKVLYYGRSIVKEDAIGAMSS